MKIQLRELCRSFLSHTTYWVIMLMVLTLSLVVSHVMLFDMHRVEMRRQKFDTNITEKTIYNILFDDLSDHSELIQRHPEIMDSMRQFQYALETEPGIRTYNAKILQWNPGEDWSFLPDEFLVGYPYTKPEPGHEDYRPINVMMISDNFLEEFGIQLSDGRVLSEDSYTYETDKSVDTILGSAYSDYFQIGDRIVLKSTEKIVLEVVGFLEPDSMYPEDSGRVQLMDHFVLLPGFESFERGERANDQFEFQFLRQLAAPNIIVEDPDIDVFELVNAMSARFGLFTLNLIPIDYASVDMYKSFAGQQADMTTGLTLVVLVVIAVTLVILISSKMRINMKPYSIYLLTGGSPWQIFRMILTEILLLVSCGVVLAMFLIRPVFLYGFSLAYHLPKMLPIVTCLIVLTTGITLIQLRKLKLAELIRRGKT